MSTDTESLTSVTPDGFTEINLGAVLRILLRGWLSISVCVVFFAIATFVALRFVPNTYVATALLAPNADDSSGSLASLAGQYGGLARIAGIDLGSGETDKTTLGLKILTSRKFIGEFIERHEILVPLIASRGWDEQTRKVLIDESQYDDSADEWVRSVKYPKQSKPSLQEAHEDFLDAMTVSRDKDSGFVTLSLKHHSPILAKRWLELLIGDLNNSVRSRDIELAEQALVYLGEQAGTTSVTEMTDMLYRLIEEQTKTIMLANIAPEYFLATIDPPVVPEDWASPNRPMLVIVGALLGLMFGSMLQALIYFRRNR